VWIFRGAESRVLLVREPIEVEMDFISKSQAVQGGGVLLHKVKKSAVNLLYSRIQWYHLLLFPLVIP
jgi:hypothetical protein